VRTWRPDVDVDLAGLLMGLLEREPAARRPGTAEELARRLLPWADRSALEELLGLEASSAPVERVPTAAEPSPPTATSQPEGDLATTLDVLVWDGTRHISLNEPGVLPVRVGTPCQIEVRLDRPAHVYLAWIGGNGTAQPLHPCLGKWEWQSDEPVERVFLPPRDPRMGKYRQMPIAGVAGIESVVLMVRSTPLPERFRERLPELLKGFPGPEALLHLADQSRSYWFTRREAEPIAEDRALDLDVPANPDPIFQIHSLLRDRLGTRFQVVQALSFVNAG
jgi:hypothetical protein